VTAPSPSSLESGSDVSSPGSRKPIVGLAVATPISPSAFRQTLEKSSLASQVAQALRTFAARSSSAATSPSEVLPTPRSPQTIACCPGWETIEKRSAICWAGAPGEEVSPIDRRRGAEGLGYPPRPIQEICLIHSRPLHDQRKPTSARVRDEWDTG
jgi:hypothetical protein